MKFASFVCRHLSKSGRAWAGDFRARTSLRRFAADSRGDVAIIFGLMFVALFLVIGLGVDYARMVDARSDTLEATDAAVLAGARALQTNGGDQAGAIQVAEAFYKQATKARSPLLSDTVDFAVTDNATAVVSNGNATIGTLFMKLGGVSSLPLLRTDGADAAKAVLAVGGNAQLNLEVSMMLDITGSMSGQKLADMKDAASDLVNIVVWDDQSKYTSKVAIVPFAYDVRLPSSAFEKATGTSVSNGYTCVVERIAPIVSTQSSGKGKNKQTTQTREYTDAAPGTGQYVMVHSSGASTKNGKTTYPSTCDLKSSAEAMPLTNDKDALVSKINGLQIAGSTAGHIGTAWAWYMLSPNWSSLWPSSSTPAPYGTDKLKKIAVLMTDGEYNTQYDSHGVSANANATTSCPNAANGCSSDQAVAQCAAMKAAGIEVYTVGFQLGGSQLATNTLSSCATDADHFYNSTTGDALKAAFRDIALKISTLYLSQ